jgi:WhiB family redox-sensing transcriptional regulator
MPNFPEAACKDIADQEIFFQTKRTSTDQAINEARQICLSCVHRQECSDFAVEEEIEFGMWGGLTAAERRKITPRKSVKHRSDLGARAFKLRQLGLTYREIAIQLDCTVSAAQKATTRYTEDLVEVSA